MAVNKLEVNEVSTKVNQWLTVRNNNGSAALSPGVTESQAIEELANYEDIGLTPEEILNKLELLKAYSSDDFEGKLIKLPCRLGDRIYRIMNTGNLSKGKPRNDSIRAYKLTEANALRCCKELEEKVFLTKADAEKHARSI